MTLKTRLHKLTNKLKPEVQEVHFFGWADCAWNECDGLVRQPNESKELFFERVRQNDPDKLIFWFE
jgi:hypothetical protein